MKRVLIIILFCASSIAYAQNIGDTVTVLFEKYSTIKEYVPLSTYYEAVYEVDSVIVTYCISYMTHKITGIDYIFNNIPQFNDSLVRFLDNAIFVGYNIHMQPSCNIVVTYSKDLIQIRNLDYFYDLRKEFNKYDAQSDSTLKEPKQ